MARKAIIPTKDKETDDRSLDDVAAHNAHKKAREDKHDEKLTNELMYGKNAHKRTVRDTIAERDRKYARLHDFYNNRSVEMMWDLSDEAIRSQVFMLRVDGKEIVLSAVELQKYLRWV